MNMSVKVGKSVIRVHVRRDNSYDLIERGIKYIEVRLLKGIVCNIEVGDIVNIVHKCKKTRVKILEIKVFSSLSEMLKDKLIRGGALPGLDISECKDYYEQFYDKRQIEKYKAVALLFRCVEGVM